MAGSLLEEDIGCVKEYGMSGSLDRFVVVVVVVVFFNIIYFGYSDF